MFQGFITFPEFAESTEFLIHLGKLHYVATNSYIWMSMTVSMTVQSTSQNEMYCLTFRVIYLTALFKGYLEKLITANCFVIASNY